MKPTLDNTIALIMILKFVSFYFSSWERILLIIGILKLLLKSHYDGYFIFLTVVTVHSKVWLRAMVIPTVSRECPLGANVSHLVHVNRSPGYSSLLNYVSRCSQRYIVGKATG